MNVVIIGNGIAGISVAKELRARQQDPAALSITVLARESYDYYSRIRLPEVFGGHALSAELLSLYKPAWYRERAIDVRLGQDVAFLDRRARRLVMSSGPDIAYDTLVLAIGSDPVRPPLPGIFLPGVLTVRDYDDAARVKRSVERNPESAVVVGGGLLGLEAARHLADSGVRKLTVLETAPRLLPRQLDERGSRILERAFEAMGIRIRTGERVSGFAGENAVDSVMLDGGESILAGTVVLSMGVRPRTGLARAAALSTARGITVNEHLRTSDPTIYAVGDCAEFNGIAWGIIPAAMEMAGPCASAILGDLQHPYGGTLPSNTLKVAGIDLFSAGIVEPEDPAAYEELAFEASAERYERYLIRDGALAGAIVIGSKLKARAVARMMGKGADRGLLAQVM